ncbi:MFS transporter [Streptomyces sp. NPDC050528]|uniref:MFS transporter n=1 Tax=unclassified Streptomyces TaxID=2593676 RepID=UPI0037A1F813
MRNRIGFLGICLGYFAVILDGSVLNVAVPDIRRDLAASMADAQWALNSYTLALAALLLTGGALGDRIGLRRTLLSGLTVFVLASVVCSLATTPAALIAARVAQGVGAAALLPTTLALIPHIFAERADRERAAVVWVATSAIAVAMGPLVGGLLIDAFGWRSVFLINVPVCALSIVLVRAGVEETRGRRVGVDWPGQILAVVALGLITGGVIAGGSQGWGSARTLGMLGAGAVTGVAFWAVERRAARPLLPLSFFAHRLRTFALLALGLTGFLFYGALFVMSLYFQNGLGWSPGDTGIGLLPLTVGTVLAPLVLYRPLSKRYGHPLMMAAGFAGFLLGTVELLLVGGDAAYGWTAVGILLMGVSSTFVPSAAVSIVVSTVSGTEGGLASGVQNTLRQTGGLLSVAVFGAVLNSTDFLGRLRVALLLMALAQTVGLAGSAVIARRARRTAGAPSEQKVRDNAGTT